MTGDQAQENVGGGRPRRRRRAGAARPVDEDQAAEESPEPDGERPLQVPTEVSLTGRPKGWVEVADRDYEVAAHWDPRYWQSGVPR